MVQPLMTLNEVAEYLRVPPTTLYVWRTRGVGPTGRRVGRYVRYRSTDVDRWLDEQASDSNPAA